MTIRNFTALALVVAMGFAVEISLLVSFTSGMKPWRVMPSIVSGEFSHDMRAIYFQKYIQGPGDPRTLASLCVIGAIHLNDIKKIDDKGMLVYFDQCKKALP